MTVAVVAMALFALVFPVGTILVGLCLVPALFLPRKPAAQPVDPAVLTRH